MADNQAEVSVNLRADDKASDVIRNMRSESDKASESVQGLGGRLATMAQQAVSNFVGNTVIPKVLEYGSELVNNAMHVQEQVRKIGSYFVTSAGAEWGTAMEKAEGVEAELARMAIRIGMDIDTARAAFSNMAKAADAGEGSIDNVLKRTEQLMQISDITLEPVETLASEYAMMEKGIVRSKGALTKMLFSTGIFGKNIKKAGAYWGKLTEEQRKSALDDAIGKLANKMEAAPQSMASLLSSLNAVKQRIMDIAGKNLVANMTPRVQALLDYLERKRPQLEQMASKFGNELAIAGDKGVEWISEKFDYLILHWDEVMNSIKDGATKVYKVAKFIVDNADTIAYAYGLHALSPTILAGIQNAGALKAMGSGITGFTGLLAAAKGGLVAFSAQLAAVALAVGAAVVAFMAAKAQYDALQKEGGMSAAWQSFRYGNKAYSEADLSGFRNSMEEALKSNRLETAAAILKTKQEAVAERKTAAQQQFGADAPEHYSAMGITAMENLVEDFSKRMPTMGDIAAANAIQTQAELVAMYNMAIRSDNQALASYVASIAGRSEALAYGLADNATLIEGGFDSFISRLDDKTKEFVGSMNKMYGEAHPGRTGRKEPKVESGVHMHGGQTFQIKQEFREADPDRIAIYMRRDLVKAATARARSRVRTPFGV
jgi:hypothetical protein